MAFSHQDGDLDFKSYFNEKPGMQPSYNEHSEIGAECRLVFGRYPPPQQLLPNTLDPKEATRATQRVELTRWQCYGAPNWIPFGGENLASRGTRFADPFGPSLLPRLGEVTLPETASSEDLVSFISGCVTDPEPEPSPPAIIPADGSKLSSQNLEIHQGENDAYALPHGLDVDDLVDGRSSSPEPEPSPHRRDDPRQLTAPQEVLTLQWSSQSDRDLALAGAGLSGHSAVMMQNVPEHYSHNDLWEQLEESVGPTFDYVYVPADYTSPNRNRGAAFVRFMSPALAGNFYAMYHGQVFPNSTAAEPVKVIPLRIEGAAAVQQLTKTDVACGLQTDDEPGRYSSPLGSARCGAPSKAPGYRDRSSFSF